MWCSGSTCCIKASEGGFKVFTICDSTTGVVCDLDLCTGQNGDGDGFMHAAVMPLNEGMAEQRHCSLHRQLIYISITWFQSSGPRHTLFRNNKTKLKRLYVCHEEWHQKLREAGKRGATRYVRQDQLLTQQAWKDRNVVSMLLTLIFIMAVPAWWWHDTQRRVDSTLSCWWGSQELCTTTTTICRFL